MESQKMDYQETNTFIQANLKEIKHLGDIHQKNFDHLDLVIIFYE